MKLEITMPKFKMPELKGIRNPLTHQGVRALAIVLAAIVVIAGAVYAANFGKRRELQEATATPQLTVPTEIPTIAPLTEEATPAVEEVTGTPAPTI